LLVSISLLLASKCDLLVSILLLLTSKSDFLVADELASFSRDLSTSGGPSTARTRPRNPYIDDLRRNPSPRGRPWSSAIWRPEPPTRSRSARWDGWDTPTGVIPSAAWRPSRMVTSSWRGGLRPPAIPRLWHRRRSQTAATVHRRLRRRRYEPAWRA